MMPYSLNYSIRIADDLKKINASLSDSFKKLASYLTEIKLNNMEKAQENDPKIQEFSRLH